MQTELLTQQEVQMKRVVPGDRQPNADGGTLAMPRDADTNAFLISLYKSVSKGSAFWFGLQRVEGRFEWVDGSALGPYNSWGPGEPNDVGGDEDCAIYVPNPPMKDKWNDYRCHDVHRRQTGVSPLLYSGFLSFR
ncbi:hypothetical protein Bbelb_241030 [Branchiostoma belcheri]|nr:hypothetical protein Bbelb_241030 [Branchiostoma belcheri]